MKEYSNKLSVKLPEYLDVLVNSLTVDVVPNEINDIDINKTKGKFSVMVNEFRNKTDAALKLILFCYLIDKPFEEPIIKKYLLFLKEQSKFDNYKDITIISSFDAKLEDLLSTYDTLKGNLFDEKYSTVYIDFLPNNEIPYYFYGDLTHQPISLMFHTKRDKEYLEFGYDAYDGCKVNAKLPEPYKPKDLFDITRVRYDSLSPPSKEGTLARFILDEIGLRSYPGHPYKDLGYEDIKELINKKEELLNQSVFALLRARKYIPMD